MGRSDDLFSAIEAVHAAGLDPSRWPVALERISRATGSCAATLEAYDLAHRRHCFWHGVGIDPALTQDYLERFRGRPRGGYAERGRVFPPGHVVGGSGGVREPFYAGYLDHAERLGEIDLRHFAAGVLAASPGGVETVFTLRRDPRLNDAEGDYLRMFSLLLDHVRMALDVSGRLREAAVRSRSLARMLDLLGVGAALLDARGWVLHANAALETLVRRQDGLGLIRGRIWFSDPEARRRFGASVTGTAVSAGRRPSAASEAFRASRPSGAPSYGVAVRPLFPAEDADAPFEAVAVMFVHDPVAARETSACVQAVPDLTPAEASLASALVRGVSPMEYARQRGLSINTVYTHLRRLKDKAGARRLPDLIHVLNAGIPPGAFVTD